MSALVPLEMYKSEGGTKVQILVLCCMQRQQLTFTIYYQTFILFFYTFLLFLTFVIHVYYIICIICIQF